MSELEIQRRQEYKRNRKKWMLIQLTAIILLAVISLGLFIGYNQMNKTQYIEYKEQGSVDYKVHYSENDFFEDEWIDKDKSYVSSLTDGIKADFAYIMKTGANMSFNYTYQIDAQLLITKKDTGAPYYILEENILPQKSVSVKNGTALKINEGVYIDYKKYDDIARGFVDTYDKNANCVLVVTLKVDVLSEHANFDEQMNNNYTTAINIPMAEDNFNITRTSTSPENETKLFEFSSIANREVLLVLAIISAVLAVIVAILLVVFMHLTKNEDVTYTAAVNRILKSYDSYIQRINGEFDCEGYQIVEIKTFNEMLGIRDTIQSPILVSENRDETMTKFLIPTNTKILYTYIIKVENYDEIYSRVVEEPVPEEPAVEEPEEIVILEEVNEEELAEALEQPEVNLEEIEIIPDDDDQFEVAPEDPGVEVVGVVWPEKKKKNKIYRYDPNGEILNEGDVVLVPTWNNTQNREVIRKATVAHANHRVEPEHIKHPLKKIIAVIKRKAEEMLVSSVGSEK